MSHIANYRAIAARINEHGFPEALGYTCYACKSICEDGYIMTSLELDAARDTLRVYCDGCIWVELAEQTAIKGPVVLSLVSNPAIVRSKI